MRQVLDSGENQGKIPRKQLIIGVFAIAIVLVLYLSLPHKATKPQVQTEVPKEFILENSHLEHLYQENNNADFANYDSSKTVPELNDYFLGKLKSENWEILTKSGVQSLQDMKLKSYDEARIYAQNRTYFITLYFSRYQDASRTKAEIAFFPRK